MVLNFIKMVEVENFRRSLLGDVGRGRAFMPREMVQSPLST